MKKRSFCLDVECSRELSRRKTHSGEDFEHPLSGLLENELFLSKLLENLVDFGLQECRLVCRKWNQVCKGLPVRLSDVPFDEIGQVPLKFPSAVGLSSSSNSQFGRLVEAFYSLAHLPQLKKLEMNLACTPGIVYELLPGYFAALAQLESLCLRNTSCCATHIGASLKRLTSLTKLQLHSTITHRSPANPITHLHKLQELSISRVFLTNESGELLFPPGPNLTRLEMEGGKSSTASLLQSIEPYAPWLRSLAIRQCRMRTYRDEWHILNTFMQLEELAMSYVHIIDDRADIGFFPTLGGLVTLTSLSLVAGVFDEKNAWSAINRLTALKTLRIEVQGPRLLHDHDGVCPIPNLSFLSALTVIGPGLNRDVSRLTNLVELCLIERQGHRMILDGSLAKLPFLKKLVLNERYLDDFPTSVFSGFSNLTSLSLGHHKHFETGFFHVLASLPQLTEFCYMGSPENIVPDEHVRQMTMLDRLHRLTLDAGKEVDLLKTFDHGSFRRLGYLEIHCTKLTKSKEKMVFQRFPCLRSLKSIQFSSAFVRIHKTHV